VEARLRQMSGHRLTAALIAVLGAAVVCTTAAIAGGAASPGRQSSPAASTVELRRSPNTVDVLIAGKLFTTYNFDPKIAKPYFQPLRSAQGTIVSRDFPIGDKVPPEHEKDPSLEPHQRPLYFGHGNINGLDFWGEAAFPKWSDDSVFGRTVLKKIEEVQAHGNSGILRALFELRDPSGRAVAEEEQAYVFRGDQSTRIVDCEFTIRANKGAPVTMGDTKEGMFAVRLAKELNSPPGQMVNSSGAIGEKQIWGKRADWVDYDGRVGGEDVGIAVLDSPKSFRHPTYWHARHYGLLAANPFALREFSGRAEDDGSWTIAEGSTLTFRYRVIIHHGDYKQARISEAYRDYAAGR
jgi:hypothetical protein